jgi:hypothetical protein
MFGIIARAAADCHPQSFRMRKIPMAALAAPVHKPDFFQVGNQLSHLARHSSIKIVSWTFADVKQAEISQVMGGFDGGAERFKLVVRVATIHGFRFMARQLNLQLHRRCVVLK